MKMRHSGLPVLFLCIGLLVFLGLTDLPTVVAKTPQSGVVSISIPIQADNQDGFEDPTFNISGDGLNDDWVGTATSVMTGWIFTNVQIPKGATILSSYIRFRGFGSSATSGQSATARVKGFADDSADVFLQNGANKPSTRSTTTTFTDWINAWTWEWQWFQTPDLSPVVQEVLNRSGWTSGNSIGFQVSNPTGTGANWCVVDNAGIPYDGMGGPGSSITLYVSYTVGPTYSISGRVTDGGNNPISGVTVSDGVGHSNTTDSSSNYTLSGLAAGTYTITPSKIGYMFSPTSRNVTVPPDATGRNFTGTIVGRIPVIIVPGYFASLCIDPSRKCGWIASDAKDVYQSLIDAFTTAGYQLDQNLFVAFYDWTRPNDTSADRLATIVNQAALNSPNGKVHIVTHSNGANVARSYIQRTNPSKVDTLVLIAPPSQGVVRSYPIWEGGDLSQEAALFSIPYKIFFALTDTAPYLSWLTHQGLYLAIHSRVPSGQELLPVQDAYLYLQNADGTKNWQNPSQMTWRNTFLESLNNNVQNLYNNTSKVVVMASKGKTTHEQIRVRSYQLTDGLLWQDGKPEEYISSAEGDGTILFSRASLPSCSLPKCEFKGTYTQSHAFPKGTDIVDEVRRDVLVAMNIPLPPTLGPVRAVASVPTDELLYAISGSTTELFVQDPQGRQIGYRTDGSFVSTIPGATYDRVTTDGKLVVVPNPLRGQYIVQVVALGSCVFR